MGSSSTSWISLFQKKRKPLGSQLWINLHPLIFSKPQPTYQIWKAQVAPILRCHGFLGCVSTKCPPSTILGEHSVSHPHPTRTRWLRMDQLIIGWINNSLSYAHLSQTISFHLIVSFSKLGIIFVNIKNLLFNLQNSKNSRYLVFSPIFKK